MTPERWQEVEELYHAALQLPAGEREDLLAQADPDLRNQVEILLAQPSAGSPLDHPAWQGIAPGPDEPDSQTLAQGHKLGHFEIVSLLGRGGMGEVYKARDPRLNRDVAIKVLPESFAHDPERVARFEREARAASALSHPNIVAVYDVGSENGTHWIASELVDGEPLNRIIRRGPLPPSKAIDIAEQIAEGLAAAHSRGIVHRDLKPANILVTPEGRVKIIDFGLAKARTSEDLSASGVTMGTPAYMSPEQLLGKEVDHRSDICSLGLILFEMLSGKLPYVFGAALPKDAAQRLGKVVGICLEREPARRFQSAADLGFALRSASKSRGARKPTWVLLAGAAAIATAGFALWPRAATTPQNLPERFLTRITSNGYSFHPAISPDGKLIAYSAAVKDPKPQIWVQQAAGGAAVQVTHEKEGADFPSFSPDGTAILYQAHDSIYETSSLGGDPRHITAGFLSRYTPDGSTILFLRRVEGWTKLFMAPRAGGTPVAIHPELIVTRFVVSPDGKTILAVGSLDVNEKENHYRWYSISVPRFQMAEVKAPPHNRSFNNLPAFWGWRDRRHTGQFVILEDYGEGGDYLLRVRVSSSGEVVSAPEQITSIPGVKFGGLSEDGRLVVSSGRMSENLWTIPIDANQGIVRGERQRITQVDGMVVRFPRLTRDGRNVLFKSGGHLILRDLTAGQQKELTVTNGGGTISPDGSWVVYSDVTRETSTLHLVSASGGEPRKLCQGCADWGPEEFTPDGSRLLVQGVNWGPPLITYIDMVDVRTGEVKPVLRHPERSLWFPRYSWDGKWMTFQKQLDPDFKHFQIFITPVQGVLPAGENRWIPLTSGEYLDDKPNLSPDGNILYFISNRDGYYCFWAQRLNPETKHPQGRPFPIQHLHYYRPANSANAASMKLNVAADKILTNLQEFNSDIWMAQLPPGK